MNLSELLEQRLLLVTGKGGTGKTTYAAALAVLAAARGKRTILVEVDAQRPSMDAIFGASNQFEPTTVRPGLDICNITWNEAIEAYLHSMIPIRRIVKLVLSNKIVSRFIDFTPGSQELVELSIIGNLADRYDLVIVDMPASGHAFSMLDIVRSAMGLFRSGPVRQRAEELRELLGRATTRLVIVAIPEEMVVNETLETWQRMRGAGMLTAEPAIFLNRATSPSLTDEERSLLERLSEAALDERQEEFVRAGRWEDRLEQATARATARLAEELPSPPIPVPPAGMGGVPKEVVGSVAVNLGRLIGLTRREIAWT